MGQAICSSFSKTKKTGASIKLLILKNYEILMDR